MFVFSCRRRSRFLNSLLTSFTSKHNIDNFLALIILMLSVWEESSFSTPVGFLRPRNPFSCSKVVVTVSIVKHCICLQSSRCPCVVVVFIYCGEGIMDAFDEALLAHGDKIHPEITKHLLSGKFL